MRRFALAASIVSLACASVLVLFVVTGGVVRGSVFGIHQNKANILAGWVLAPCLHRARYLNGLIQNLVAIAKHLGHTQGVHATFVLGWALGHQFAAYKGAVFGHLACANSRHVVAEGGSSAAVVAYIEHRIISAVRVVNAKGKNVVVGSVGIFDHVARNLYTLVGVVATCSLGNRNRFGSSSATNNGQNKRHGHDDNARYDNESFFSPCVHNKPFPLPFFALPRRLPPRRQNVT